MTKDKEIPDTNNQVGEIGLIRGNMANVGGVWMSVRNLEVV